MIPLNTVERRSSFFTFLFFFIITITLVVIIAFFGLQIPFKENKIMKDQIAQYQKDQLFRQDFEAEALKTKGILDKLDKQGVDFAGENSAADARISELSQKIGVDSSAKTAMYRAIVSNLRDIQRLKGEMINKQGDQKTVDALQAKIADLQSRLDNCYANHAVAPTN